MSEIEEDEKKKKKNDRYWLKIARKTIEMGKFLFSVR